MRRLWVMSDSHLPLLSPDGDDGALTSGQARNSAILITGSGGEVGHGGLGLLGISINGTIVVLALLNANEAAKADDVIAQREIVVAATRHIIATTLTTMGGFVPIILQGDVFWMPLATGIAGGVAGSAILALYFTPAMFRIMTMKPMRRLIRLLTGRGWQHPARVPAE